MTSQQAILALQDCAKDRDIEVAHEQADDILCLLLDALGYEDVVSAYMLVPKCYA